MPFLYGNHVVKAHIGKTSEDITEHQGVVIYSMADTPLGFGVTSRSTIDTRKLDPTAIVVFNQACVRFLQLTLSPLSLTLFTRSCYSDVGEYLRDEVRASPSLPTLFHTTERVSPAGHPLLNDSQLSLHFLPSHRTVLSLAMLSHYVRLTRLGDARPTRLGGGRGKRMGEKVRWKEKTGSCTSRLREEGEWTRR